MSKRSHVTIGKGFGASRPLRTVVPLNKTSAQLRREHIRRRNAMSDLTAAERQTLEGDNGDFPMDVEQGGTSEHGAFDIDMQDAPALGDEAVGLAAGDGSDSDSDADDAEAAERKLFQRSRKVDLRVRRERLLLRDRSWQSQIPLLASAYLHWKFNGPPPPLTVEAESPFTVEAVDFFDKTTLKLSHRPTPSEPEVQYSNETLVKHGYLGNSPDKPTLALSFRTLEAYRQLHRVCPRLRPQAFTRALCHLHGVPVASDLRTMFQDTYDTYLLILYAVQDQIDAELARPKDWRSTNVCPPCMYTLEEECELVPSMLTALDGNMSLRMVDDAILHGTRREDAHVRRLSMWVEPSDVDVFKDEVANAKKSRSKKAAIPAVDNSTPAATESDSLAAPDAEDWVDIEVDVEEDARPEEPSSLATCMDRWRNAGPEARKKMFTMFAISGVFIAACRHGHLLFLCDMIRSGELMKYPLALLCRLLTLFGRRLGIGYDIGCAFSKTVANSSLGQAFKELEARVLVPAFHGHSHNRLCQLNWHPMYVKGVGLEDFETCERIFSLSNHLAGTRTMTKRHRDQDLEEHFAFQDEDKSASIGRFLCDNYRQALRIESELRPQLTALEMRLQTKPEDYVRFINEERQYLENLKQEPRDIVDKITYMESLERLENAHRSHDKTSATWVAKGFDKSSSYYRSDAQKKLQKELSTWLATIRAAEADVIRHEAALDITERWTSDSPEYRNGVKLLRERKYRRALDQLERLMVQRLMELTKLSQSGLGYKQREKIGKALKTRGAAIQTALNEFNAQAKILGLATLTWSSLVEVMFVGELDLLKDARTDIRRHTWAKPEYRQATSFYFKLLRAKEEITRLNVEIRRQITFMLDEHDDYFRAIDRLRISNPNLARELVERSSRQQRRNAVVMGQFFSLSELAGFTGDLSRGKRVGRAQNALNDVPRWFTSGPAADEDSSDESDVEDIVIDFMEKL